MALKCGFLKTCLVFSSHFDFKCQIHSTNTSKRLYLEHEICIDTEPGAVVIIGIFLNCHLHQQTSASYCQQPTSAAYRIQHGLARLLHSFLLSIQVVQCELLYVSAASSYLVMGKQLLHKAELIWPESAQNQNEVFLFNHITLQRITCQGMQKRDSLATIHLVQVQVTSLGKTCFREISYIFRVPLYG